MARGSSWATSPTPTRRSVWSRRRDRRRSGCTLARRLLVEAAWQYARQPGEGLVLRRRQAGQPDHVIQIASPSLAAVVPRPRTQEVARQARQRHRRRLPPRTRLLPLGGQHRRLARTRHSTRSTGRGAGPQAAGTRDRSMSSPPRAVTLGLRQRSPAARTPGPGVPTPRFTDENVKGCAIDSLPARVTPNEKRRRWGL